MSCSCLQQQSCLMSVVVHGDLATAAGPQLLAASMSVHAPRQHLYNRTKPGYTPLRSLGRRAGRGGLRQTCTPPYVKDSPVGNVVSKGADDSLSGWRKHLPPSDSEPFKLFLWEPCNSRVRQVDVEKVWGHAWAWGPNQHSVA